MAKMIGLIRVLFISFLIFQTNDTFASRYEASAEQDIEIIYNQLNSQSELTSSERLDFISQFFLNKPYRLGPLGEGEKARFDQYPLYRTDGFDCITYVETVLAIYSSSDVPSFRENIINIRYLEGNVSYISRKHFPSTDWNPSNQRQHYLNDITAFIVDKNNSPVYQIASAVIDKPSFYDHLDQSSIRLKSNNEQLNAQRLQELKKMGGNTQATLGTIPYIPLTALYSTEGKARESVFNQIPDGSIIEIIRPNWDLTDQIGTHQNVSHIGFVFRKNDILIFRDASSLKQKVSNTPLSEYLKKYLESPTIKGINIQIPS